MKNKKTILVTAYAVNPFKGSEDGMGWNFILQIARFHKVIAITRENNQKDIDKYMQLNPNENYENIQFYYFDLPFWMRFWKKGNFASMLYFCLWQYNIVSFIKDKVLEFDVAHNLNFHNDWTPSYLWKLDKPFVWGPIGHHSPIPENYLNNYGFNYKLSEKIKWKIKQFFWNNSSHLTSTIKNADHILCMNSEVEKMIPLETISHSIMPSVASENNVFSAITKPTFRILSIGRLVPLKGFDLTIKAFKKCLDVVENKDSLILTIVGSGPEKEFYHKLVKDLKIENNVEFIEWVKRDQLKEIYLSASVFLFPSHEGAGMVVSEALSYGLPVICLDNSGPGEFINENCGFAVSVTDYETTISELALKLVKLIENPDLLHKMQLEARIHFENKFDWNVRGEQLKRIYSKLLS